ncbi:MAG: hypothetical protein ABF285_12645 [Pacificibacter sp.]
MAFFVVCGTGRDGILGLDVAMVTVIHLARMFIIMPLLGRLVARLPAAKD